MNLDTEQGHIIVCLMLIGIAIVSSLDFMPLPANVKAQLFTGLWTLASGVLGKALAEPSKG